MPAPAGSRPSVQAALPPASSTNLPAVPPPAVAAPPDAGALLKALQRRWPLALVLCVLAGGGALAAAYFLVPAKYSVVASVQVASTNPDLASKTQWRAELFPTIMKTQAARIKNRDVLLRALNYDEVRNLPIVRQFSDTLSTISWLDKELKVDFQDGSEFLTVSLDSDSPEEAVVLLDGVVKAYLSLVNGKENDQRHDHSEKVRKMIKSAKEKLAEKITTRDGLCKGEGAPDSAAMIQKHQSLQQQYQEAQRQLFTSQLELEKAQAKFNAAKNARVPLDITAVPDFFLQREMQADPVLKSKLDLLANLERAVRAMQLAGHPEDDLLLTRTQGQLAAVRRDVEHHREAKRKETFDQYREQKDAEFKAKAQELAEEIKPLQNAVKRASDRAEALLRATETAGISTAKLDLLNTEIKQGEASLADLQKNLQELQLAEAADFRVSLGQDAGWLNQMSKKRLILLLMIPVAAVGAAAFGLAFLEFRARRIHSTDEVVAGLGLRVVGSVPVLTLPRGRRHPALQAATGDLAQPLGESIDAIRTTLLRSAAADGTRAVMVTSAVSGEGKTTLAASLALSLARAGRRTVLVDCDLRRPAAHQLFEQTLQPGFSEVLLGEVELPDAVRPTTSDENLWLLPAGQWDREVLAELAKDQPAAVFERLREEFDFVVVDSHPVLPATDSLLVGQHTDAVIVAVMRQVSQAPRVYAATQRLATLGIRVFGAVVNGVQQEEYGGYACKLQEAA
jgi:capsular exopolysaccharide synthesis family protein